MNENGKIIFKWVMDDKYKKQSIQSYINKLHIDYIATREGTDCGNNEHGLFGYIKESDNVEGIDLNNIKKYVQDISNNNVKIIKTIISLREEDAIYKGLTSKEAWKSVLKDRIRGIAEEYNIEFQNLEWVASYHIEKGHPHVHLVFWDKSELTEYKKRTYVNFTNIKKNISKGIFKEELDELYDKQNKLKKIIAEDVKEFNKEYKESEVILNQIKEEMPGIYNNPILNPRFVDLGVEKISNNLSELRNKVHNYKYQEQTKEVKALIDETSKLILNSSRDCFNTFNKYIETSMKIGEILTETESEKRFDRVKQKATTFMFNKMGNQILKFLKSEEFEKSRKEEYEKKVKKYEESRIIKEQEFLEEQIDYLEEQFKNDATRLFSEMFHLLSQESISIEGKYGSLKAKYSNLSKQAKKEKYLEQRNTGLDWFTL